MERATIILFGSTGDLTKRKLIPALYHLFSKGKLSKDSAIVCLGRRVMTKAEYIDFLELPHFISNINKEIMDDFLSLVYYEHISYEQPDAQRIQQSLQAIEQAKTPNRILYVATPPDLFVPIVRVIEHTQIHKTEGWVRIAFEKPFGVDLQSAQELHTHILKVFDESQVYRIDHYLGKELVKNIMAFRFANSIFEESWNAEHIDHVQITVAETKGVGHRANYYNNSGAIRDMLQNHLLELVALVGMQTPQTFDGETIRQHKYEVFKHIGNMEQVVTGQYESGMVDQTLVDGYAQELGHQSTTETFVAVKFFIHTPRWHNVPFYVRTGKRMHKNYAHINIVFKDVYAQRYNAKEHRPNVLNIRIQPDEGISLRINSRVPGTDNTLEYADMDFCHKCLYFMDTPEAYESLMQAIIREDKTQFARWDSVQETWRIIDNIRKQLPTPLLYQAGSQGPQGIVPPHVGWL